MKKEKQRINLIKTAETLGTVHTRTHTSSFIGLNNAIFAFINNVKKTDYEFVS